MSRSIPYGQREVRAVAVEGAVDVAVPIAGYYRARLGRDTVRGGVRIWHGPPADPETGELLDRSWRWQAEFNREAIDFDRVWPLCAGEPITEADYLRYCNRVDWALSNAPDSAYAERGARIDHLSTATPLQF